MDGTPNALLRASQFTDSTDELGSSNFLRHVLAHEFLFCEFF